MMRTVNLHAASAGLATLAVATAAFAGGGVIYDNSSTPTGSTSFTALQIGDEVIPEGRNRLIVRLEIGLTQQGVAGTGDVQAWLYANDGVDGQPGTLLWESALMEDIDFTGGNDLIPFEVPSVEVPDVFTWMVQISNTEPVAVGVPHFHPPTVGSSPDHAWFGDGPPWTKLDLKDPVNFMARITAAAADCPEDFDGGGDVGFTDLLSLLEAWGPCPGCVEDLDGSGEVGFADLVAVLAAWGPCP